jgi:hypothetical protein
LSSRSTKNATSDRSLRIVTQYRSGASMEYELECDGVELCLRISPRATSADSGDWRVEARAGRAGDAACIAEWGATRGEALREVGRAWGLETVTKALPPFDWEAVARALTAVRAL